MKVSGKKARRTGRVPIITQMVTSTRANGKMTSSMARGSTHILMGIVMRVTGKMTLSTDRENIIMRMVLYTKGNGKMMRDL